MGYKAKEVLNTLAKTAADQYLKSKTPMNSTLKKIASSEGLEPHQVEYVAAEANKLVWADHYANDRKAAYDFPLADPHQVVGDLQIKPVEKVAEVNLDYALPPATALKKEASDAVVTGEFATNLTDGRDRRELRQNLTARYEKLAQAKEVAQGEALLLQAKIETLEKAFVKEARTFVISTPFTERLETMEKIAEFVRSTGHLEVGRRLMEKLSAEVARTGLVKEADLKAPEEYISENLPARIINGNHSLYITIDTIVKREHELANYQRNFTIVDDTLPVLKEKIRGL